MFNLFKKNKPKKEGLTEEQCKKMCLKAVITSVCPKACNVCAYNYMFYKEKK